jgi:hypothetical protein
VGFVVGKVTLEQVFINCSSFIIIYHVTVADVPSGLGLTPPQEQKEHKQLNHSTVTFGSYGAWPTYSILSCPTKQMKSNVMFYYRALG